LAAEKGTQGEAWAVGCGKILSGNGKRVPLSARLSNKKSLMRGEGLRGSKRTSKESKRLDWGKIGVK